MHSTDSEKALAKVFSPILSAAALGLLLAGCSSSVPANPEDDVQMPSSSSEPAAMSSSSSSDVMMKTTSLYRDGTYSADGVYRSPAGGESVHVSVTLKDDTITDATFVGDATHEKSIKMQAAFAEGYADQVVGRSIDDVSVGVVNGSSLTGGGFMEALEKIKTDAKA